MEGQSNDEDDHHASKSSFRPFKSNIKSKNLAPPASAFAKADDEDEDEEDDYMSAGILKEIGDVRPGLVKSKATLRKYECEERAKKKNEENRLRSLAGSSKALEKANREEALGKSALDPSNVGFKLMQKMGFKAGQALGSQQPTSAAAAGKRLLEPISVELKSDREGLGKTEERKKKLVQIRELTKRYHELRRLNEAQATQSYLEHKRIRFQVRRLVRNLHKCQRICHQLDSTNVLAAPEVKWYWPMAVRKHMKLRPNEPAAFKEPKAEETSEMEDAVVKDDQPSLAREENKPLKDVNIRRVYEERLQAFINEPAEEQPATTSGQSADNDEEESDNDDVDSKERKYFQEQFAKEKAKSDSEDLSDKEAGRSSGAKKRGGAKDSGQDQDEEDDEDEEDENGANEQIISQKIDAICSYLREKYLYCVWCSVRYENEASMNETCPGLREDEHED